MSEKTTCLTSSLTRTAFIDLDKIIDVLTETAGVDGKCVWCGIGKAGHIARYGASLMSSAAMESAFLHPAEAVHGDFGVLGARDCLIVISHSGASIEPLAVMEHAQWLRRVPVIAITSDGKSPIGNNADHVILYEQVDEEFGKVPANASLIQLSIVNRIVIGTAKRLNRGIDYLTARHPGGSIGAEYRRK